MIKNCCKIIFREKKQAKKVIFQHRVYMELAMCFSTEINNNFKVAVIPQTSAFIQTKYAGTYVRRSIFMFMGTDFDCLLYDCDTYIQVVVALSY